MRHRAGIMSVRFGWISILLLLPCLLTSVADSQTVRVDITPGHAVNSFVPTEALGAGVDRIETATTDKMFVEPVIRQVLSAGWQTVTYRQNTELHIQAWHWNPQGVWSDPGGKVISSATPSRAISSATHSATRSPIAGSRATTAPTPTVFRGLPMATRAPIGRAIRT